MNKHLSAAVLANCLCAAVFVPWLNYAMVRQFEETIVFLGIAYALVSGLANVFVVLSATKSRGLLPILAAVGLVLATLIAAGVIGVRLTV